MNQEPQPAQTPDPEDEARVASVRGPDVHAAGAPVKPDEVPPMGWHRYWTVQWLNGCKVMLI